MKFKLITKLFIFIAVTVASSYILLSYCDCNCTICFYIDTKSCDLSEQDLNGATLNVEVYHWITDEFGPIPVLDAVISGPPVPGTIKKVSGYEINYGFWSKDSYREYTWEEMFKWKYGHYPETPAELALLTEQNVKNWFIERHTVERPWPLSDDPPRDVRTFEKPLFKLCTQLYDNCHYIFMGNIKFSDGTKCELEPMELFLRAGGCPAYIAMKVKKGCSKCGGG